MRMKSPVILVVSSEKKERSAKTNNDSLEEKIINRGEVEGFLLSHQM